MSALPNPEPLRFTPEEYLEIERAAETKSEYFDGEIVARSGGIRRHSAIAVNTSAELHSQLRGKPYFTFTCDLRVAAPNGTMFAYPDVSVACGEKLFSDDSTDVLTNPVLIVEVLSPSSESLDRSEKLVHYRQIEVLTDYLIVSQNEPLIEHHRRLDADRWLITLARGLEASVEILALGVVLRLSEVYDKIEFTALDHDESA